MAHFAELDENNIVKQVIVVDNENILKDGIEDEQTGIEFIRNIVGEYTTWKKASYNTKGVVHTGGGIPFRKNFPGVGWIYDETRDAFRIEQPYPSWVLNEQTCLWEAPVEAPEYSRFYSWNEQDQVWVEED